MWTSVNVKSLFEELSYGLMPNPEQKEAQGAIQNSSKKDTQLSKLPKDLLLKTEKAIF